MLPSHSVQFREILQGFPKQEDGFLHCKLCGTHKSNNGLVLVLRESADSQPICISRALASLHVQVKLACVADFGKMSTDEISESRTPKQIPPIRVSVRVSAPAQTGTEMLGK